MGVWHDFYLEGEVGGENRCLDRFVKLPDGGMRHCALLSVRSMPTDVEYQVGMEDEILENLSAEVRGEFPAIPGLAGMHGQCKRFALDAINVDSERYQYEYYVPREAMNDFKRGLADRIEHWLTEAEYAALPAARKASYVFFRWDDPYSGYGVLKRLKREAKAAIEAYESASGLDVVNPSIVVRFC